MQELLGRLRSLDPEASAGLRIIACFDELMSGSVGIHGLLSAAAALAGRPAALRRGSSVRIVGPDGETVSAPAEPSAAVEVEDGTEVWLVGDDIRTHDALILERLSLAVRVRVGAESDTPARRDLAVVLDTDAPDGDRRAAAERLGLNGQSRYRVVAAPLYATWTRHPGGVEDVVASSDGPLHVVVVASHAVVAASPVGVGVAVSPEALASSFRTARIALLLHDGRSSEPSTADDLGGLAEILAELSSRGRSESDAEALDAVMTSPWGPATVEALVRTSSVREAARRAGVHHSTMTQRVDTLSASLGFDPLGGLGRTRLGLAWLLWRLGHSRVLELPSVSAR